jgi:peptidoglycan/xylan/chitin deacetylase (PgdA/CDA1 family)
MISAARKIGRSLKRTLNRVTSPFRSAGIVLLYHRVTTLSLDPWSLAVTPEHFDQHMSVLRKFRARRLRDMARHPTSRSVAVTFDDGYADNLAVARPIMDKYDIPGSVFVVTGYVGGLREFWWDELEQLVFQPLVLPAVVNIRIGEVTERLETSSRKACYTNAHALLQPLGDSERQRALRFIAAQTGITPQLRPSHRQLTACEVRELARNDLIEVGAHTMTHPWLSARGVGEQAAEIVGSKLALEEWLDRPVTTFSYPYGGPQHYSAVTSELVRTCGFHLACTTNPHHMSRHFNPYQTPRIVIQDMDGDGLERVLDSVMRDL